MDHPKSTADPVNDAISGFNVLDGQGRPNGSSVFRISDSRENRIVRCVFWSRMERKTLYGEIRGNRWIRAHFQTSTRRGKAWRTHRSWLVLSPKGSRWIREKLGHVWEQNLPGSRSFLPFARGFSVVPWWLTSSGLGPVSRRGSFVDLDRGLSGRFRTDEKRPGNRRIGFEPDSRRAALSVTFMSMVIDRAGIRTLGAPVSGERMVRTSQSETPPIPFPRWIEPPRPNLHYRILTPAGAERTIRFSAADGTLLSGTIETPEESPPKAIIVLVHGSGAENRDTGCGYEGRDIEKCVARPFQELSRKLARDGLAVFRYDKRGIGKSEGDWPSTLHSELLEDVLAAVRTLRGRFPDLPLVLMGFSEGGVLALRAARRSPLISGLILAGTPGRQVDQVVLAKTPVRLRLLGLPPRVIRETVRSYEEIFDRLRSLPKTGTAGTVFGQPASWWADHLQAPAPSAESRYVRCPVLLLHGTDDLEVLIGESHELARALRTAGVPLEIHRLKGLNHFFTPAFRRHPGFEYDIPFPISSAVPRIAASWIRRLN